MALLYIAFTPCFADVSRVLPRIVRKRPQECGVRIEPCLCRNLLDGVLVRVGLAVQQHLGLLQSEIADVIVEGH